MEGTSMCLHLNCNRDGDGDGDGDDDGGRGNGRKEVLQRVEDLLWGALGAEGRSEARLWLCTDVGSLRNVPRNVQASLFLSLIRPTGDHKDAFDELLCYQTLRVACEKRPRCVMQLFAKDNKLIRNFFSGHPKRILDWFEKFSTSHKRENELGAQALAHFAFIHRDRFWKELKWKGTHGQAPATVASKPHYFLDLDVLGTVKNFLDYVPEFWSSDELWDSLKDGELISVDMDYFVKKLFQRMVDRSCPVWEMLEQFFFEEDFAHLCHRLLSFLGDQKLLVLVNKLSLGLAHASVEDNRKAVDKYNWLAEVLKMGAECLSLDCVLICNACIAHSRQLLRLLHSGENVQEYNSLISLLLEWKNSNQRKHGDLWKGCMKWNKWELVKLLALESWSIQILILKECTSTTSLGDLLSANSIQFRHGSSGGKGKKDIRLQNERRKKRKKKRRRKADWSSEEGLNSSQSDVDSGDHNLLDNDGCWYLSLDNFTVGLEKDELPERLSSFAFRQWLEWLTAEP